jgi:hypothetical protein
MDWIMIQNVEEDIRSLSQRPVPLLVVAGPRGSGKTAILRTLESRGIGRYWNLNRVMAHLLQDLSREARPGALSPDVVMAHMARNDAESVWLWDHIELLFLPELKVDVLPWLKRCARKHPLVVAWPGEYHQGHLIFSRLGRDDHYRSERDREILVRLVQSS